MWNMQSGVKRKSFQLSPLHREAGPLKRKLDVRPVTGLATDALNTLVIASTLDGTIEVSHSFKIQHICFISSTVF
jgi:U3 small nucleolar RNA-associated protein 21